jgi:Gram-negative bacterial TonB protein C-terminal
VRMSRLSNLGVVVCLVSGLAWHQSRAIEPMPRPGDGAVANGAYTNKYFDMAYPLPPEWTEGLAGPDPSQYGYYVLTTVIPSGEFTAMVMIAAQDQFFAAKPFSDAAAMARELGRETAKLEGMTIDGPPSEVSLGGRSFTRIDTSGFGLFNSTWITQSRCHLVSFNITAKSEQRRADLAASLNKLAPARASGEENPDPVCMKNQADTKNLLTRVDPAPIAPFAPIPVRVIIGRDGSVKHVNVVRGSADQRSAIENALGQWKFKPPAIDGRPAEIETGLVIEFTAQGQVKYSTGDRLRDF